MRILLPLSIVFLLSGCVQLGQEEEPPLESRGCDTSRYHLAGDGWVQGAPDGAVYEWGAAPLPVSLEIGPFSADIIIPMADPPNGSYVEVRGQLVVASDSGATADTAGPATIFVRGLGLAYAYPKQLPEQYEGRSLSTVTPTNPAEFHEYEVIITSFYRTNGVTSDLRILSEGHDGERSWIEFYSCP